MTGEGEEREEEEEGRMRKEGKERGELRIPRKRILWIRFKSIGEKKLDSSSRDYLHDDLKNQKDSQKVHADEGKRNNGIKEETKRKGEDRRRGGREKLKREDRREREDVHADWKISLIRGKTWLKCEHHCHQEDSIF